MAERRKALETQRLVELVGLERRQREARVERHRQAKARAKATLLRTQHIADKRARDVMRKARGYAATKYEWED
jgi:hypothetical protein